MPKRDLPSSSRAAPPVTFWLTAALIALPFLQALPIDFERSAALVVLLPALWSGRRVLPAAVAELGQGKIWIRGAFALLGGAIVVSLVFSDHRAPAAVGAASWLLLAAAGALAGRVAQADDRASRQLMTGLALGAAAGAAAMWTLWLTGGRGAVPLYAHHRIFGLHMLVGAMASTALVVRSSTAPQRWRWLAVGALNWGAVLWSGGRGPLVALAGGLGCWFLARPGDRKPLVTATVLLVLAGLALSAGFWTPQPELGWWHAFARTAAATQQGTVDVSALTSTRSEFWRASVEHGLRSPWVGHGPDAYRFLTPKLDGQQPHNVVLQLWLDLGLLGALPALGLLGGAVFAGWRLARRGDTGGAHLSVVDGASGMGILPMSSPDPADPKGRDQAQLPAVGTCHDSRPTGSAPCQAPLLVVGKPPLLVPCDRPDQPADAPAAIAPWVALLTALILGGLLDGIFYHVLTLLPVMLAIGVVLFATGVPDSVRVPARRGPWTSVAPAVGGAAIVILALHAFVFHALVVAPPPSGPAATSARLVRAFPSTTFGLWVWLDQWYPTNPDAALAWARWAQAHATNPAIFHIRAAQYLHAQGHRAAALEELRLAEAKAHWATRPSIAALRQTMFDPP